MNGSERKTMRGRSGRSNDANGQVAENADPHARRRGRNRPCDRPRSARSGGANARLVPERSASKQGGAAASIDRGLRVERRLRTHRADGRLELDRNRGRRQAEGDRARSARLTASRRHRRRIVVARSGGEVAAALARLAAAALAAASARFVHRLVARDLGRQSERHGQEQREKDRRQESHPSAVYGPGAHSDAPGTRFDATCGARVTFPS